MVAEPLPAGTAAERRQVEQRDYFISQSTLTWANVARTAGRTTPRFWLRRACHTGNLTPTPGYPASTDLRQQPSSARLPVYQLRWHDARTCQEPPASRAASGLAVRISSTFCRRGRSPSRCC